MEVKNEEQLAVYASWGDTDEQTMQIDPAHIKVLVQNIRYWKARHRDAIDQLDAASRVLSGVGELAALHVAKHRS